MKIIKIISVICILMSSFSLAFAVDTSKCDKIEKKAKKYDCLMDLKKESVKSGTKEQTKKIKANIKKLKKSFKDSAIGKKYNKFNSSKTLFDLFKKSD